MGRQCYLALIGELFVEGCTSNYTYNPKVPHSCGWMIAALCVSHSRNPPMCLLYKVIAFRVEHYWTNLLAVHKIKNMVDINQQQQQQWSNPGS